MQAVGGVRAERAVNAEAVRVAAGQQRGARRRTDGLRDVEIGEFHPVARQAVEVRRRETLRPEDPDVAVPLVIGEDDDDVRGTLGRGGGGGGGKQTERQERRAVMAAKASQGHAGKWTGRSSGLERTQRPLARGTGAGLCVVLASDLGEFLRLSAEQRTELLEHGRDVHERILLAFVFEGDPSLGNSASRRILTIRAKSAGSAAAPLRRISIFNWTLTAYGAMSARSA